MPRLPSTYESTFERCTFYSVEDPDEVLWVAAESRSGYTGLIALEGCVFVDCDFYRVGLLVKERDYDTFLRELRGETPELEEGTGEAASEEPPNSR